MKTFTSILLTAIIMFFVPGLSSVHAQRTMHIKRDDIRFLDTVHTANLEFRYDDLQIKEDSATLINRRTFKKSKHARPSFTFDNHRKDLYESYFQKVFNTASTQLKAGDYPDAYYNLTIDIKSLEPGFHILRVRRRAVLKTDLIITPKQQSDHILLKISGHKAVGTDTGRNNEDFDNRIMSGYGQLANTLVTRSMLYKLPKARNTVHDMERFFAKETYGTAYSRNKQNEKLFMVLGIVQSGAGLLTGLINGMMESPGGSPDDQEMLRREKKKYAFIASGIAISSVPSFIISRNFRTKALKTKIFLTLDNQPLNSRHYAILPAIGINASF